MNSGTRSNPRACARAVIRDLRRKLFAAMHGGRNDRSTSVAECAVHCCVRDGVGARDHARAALIERRGFTMTRMSNRQVRQMANDGLAHARNFYQSKEIAARYGAD